MGSLDRRFRRLELLRVPYRLVVQPELRANQAEEVEPDVRVQPVGSVQEAADPRNGRHTRRIPCQKLGSNSFEIDRRGRKEWSDREVSPVLDGRGRNESRRSLELLSPTSSSTRQPPE